MDEYISNLKSQLLTTRLIVQQLECELEQAKKSCKHVFMLEDDGDYHKKTYYYICKKCDYVTQMKPVYFINKNK
jgi:hypothetical protein